MIDKLHHTIIRLHAACFIEIGDVDLGDDNLITYVIVKKSGLHDIPCN